MDDETPNLLRTAPIRRRAEQSLTTFILKYADDLRARREQGERAEDMLPLVAQMLGRSVKLVTFASLLSRLVPLKGVEADSAPQVGAPPELPRKTIKEPEPGQRAREPPVSGSGVPGRVFGDNHIEQIGVVRPVKSKIFVPN